MLDHVLINNANLNITINNIDCSISDHSLLVCEFNTICVLYDESLSIKKNIDYNEIVRSLKVNPLILQDSNVNSMCDCFINDMI